MGFRASLDGGETIGLERTKNLHCQGVKWGSQDVPFERSLRRQKKSKVYKIALAPVPRPMQV